MNEHEMEDLLANLLQNEDEAPDVRRVTTFEEAGILTYNRGLIVRTEDGSEFQITIVRSR
ncbi:MAG: hypothetical protein BWX88_03447 [Planctomycetes bacterium ADurb.Bin126]|nr:MAG: hypothetical protein BWX88_03447 [Planctomycetes bacterium ADurb.Bin126]HOD84367.1 hypothetical protein [Phycisphaerae bacterium]HQL76039.1 hypothetical protein [Phycisphaerae bacterium]